MYYVPNVGPSVYMTEAARTWVERIGSKVENKEFTDLDQARAFAERIHSQVTDKKGKVLYDPSDPAAGARADGE